MFKYFFFHLHLPPKKSVKRIEIVWTLELLTDKISRFLSEYIPVRLMVVEKELRNVTTAEFYKQAPRHQGHGKL